MARPPRLAGAMSFRHFGRGLAEVFERRLLSRQGAASHRQYQAAKTRAAALRDRIARDIHDDMGSSSGSIRLLSELAQGTLRLVKDLPADSWGL